MFQTLLDGTPGGNPARRSAPRADGAPPGQRPFARLEHDLVSDDTRVTDGELRWYGVLKGFMKAKGYCRESNATIGKVRGGRNADHIARVLKRLAAVGLIRLEYYPRAGKHDTGRIIHDLQSIPPEATAAPRNPRAGRGPKPFLPPRSAPFLPPRSAPPNEELGCMEKEEEKTVPSRLPETPASPPAPEDGTGRDDLLSALGEGEGKAPTPEVAERIADLERQLVDAEAEAARLARSKRDCDRAPRLEIIARRTGIAESLEVLRGLKPPPGPPPGPPANRPAVDVPAVAPRPQAPRPTPGPVEMAETIGFLTAKRPDMFAAKGCDLLREPDNPDTYGLLLNAGKMLRPDWVAQLFRSAFKPGVRNPGKFLSTTLTAALKDKRRRI